MAERAYQRIAHGVMVVVALSQLSEPCTGPFFDITSHRNYRLLPMDTCGDNSADRIVGGQVANMGEYPWMVRVGYKLKNCSTATDEFRCGGALITDKWVLTAAHCVTALPINRCPKIGTFHNYAPTIVRLGEHNTESDPDCEDGVCAEKVQDISIEKFIAFPNYGHPRYRHDIGLIRLSQPAKINSWVNTLCMVPGPRARIERFMNQTAIVAGWGIIDPHSAEFSKVLMMLRLPIVEFQQCVTSFGKLANLSSTHQLCAGGKKGQDSCSGDSGGPLFLVDETDEGPKFHVLGVVSFGNKLCAEHPTPAVYTNVLRYARWILNNLD